MKGMNSYSSLARVRSKPLSRNSINLIMKNTTNLYNQKGYIGFVFEAIKESMFSICGCLGTADFLHSVIVFAQQT